MRPTLNQRGGPLPGIIGLASGKPTVLYLINQYPAVSHTFIKREVLALEQLGLAVVRVAARAGNGLVDPGDLEEQRRTIYLLRSPLSLLGAAIWHLFLRPHRFARATIATLRMMRRSDRGPLSHIVYLIEACGVAALVRTTGAAHIHAHFGTNPAEVALLASILADTTYSFTVHGCEEYDKPEFIGLRAKIGRSAFVVAVSHYGRAQLYRWSERTDHAKIKLVRCGLDRRFHDASEDAPCAAPRLLCVGRLCGEKGYDVLVEAAALMVANGRQFQIDIIGDGELRTELETLIAFHRLSGTVRLLGSLSNVEVRRELIGARALVVSSLAENLPIVIMEAMALRRVVIASQIAGIPEIVTPRETGWLVPPGSAEALATAMTECLMTPSDELSAMGRRARERVLAFHDVEAQATALADLFATTASRQREAIDDPQYLSTAVR